MAFESISQKYTFKIPDFPEEWLPLIYLYDADLPLFPLLYFHCIDPTLEKGARPGEYDRVFGFVHHLNLLEGYLEVTVALNKDLGKTANAKFIPVVEKEVRDRLGISDPIRFDDLDKCFSGKLASSNKLIKELWYEVIDQSFGKSLPFGRLHDPVFGLGRFIASWFSEGGRKGELIQAHFFTSEFGERIQTGGGIHVDFYLLPTFEEFVDTTNPLSRFPKFAELVNAAIHFTEQYCSEVSVEKYKFSKFSPALTKAGTKLKTELVMAIINRESGKRRDALFENFSAFNRGPQRSVLSLMMIADLRRRYWNPENLAASECAAMYAGGLERTYQSPKVIQLYAQQCFGAAAVLPIDNWVRVFLDWPLAFKADSGATYHEELFGCAANWGKIERLIWIAAQSRKVHSSNAAEILWCIRFGGRDKTMRGANPLACKVCKTHIRESCPAYAREAKGKVSFNAAIPAEDVFQIATSAEDNKTPNQQFVSCTGPCTATYDEYTPRDRAAQFKPYPVAGHKGEDLTVEEFIQRY